MAVKFLLRNYKEGKEENAREDKGWADAEGKGVEYGIVRARGDVVIYGQEQPCHCKGVGLPILHKRGGGADEL
mgnify:FL=1